MKSTTKPQHFWCGDVPAHDDFGREIAKRFVDGKTNFGPWAIMAPESWVIHGRALGMGWGQMYERQSDGRWLKTAG